MAVLLSTNGRGKRVCLANDGGAALQSDYRSGRSCYVRSAVYSLVCCAALKIGQVNQIRIDRSQFLIIHFSNGAPRHFLAELMAAGIGPGAHGGYELLPLPFLHKSEAGSHGPQLTFHAAGQISAVACAAIL